MDKVSSNPLSVGFCGIAFASPFVLSAGPPTDDLDMVRRAFSVGWPGAVLKTTSLESEVINYRSPIIARDGGYGRSIDAWGNVDAISVHHVVEVEKRIGALKREFPEKIVGASVTARLQQEWQELARRVEDAGADFVEVSSSCPGATFGTDLMLGQDPNALATVVTWLKSALKNIPLVVKLTPQVTDIAAIGLVAEEMGADAICVSDSQSALLGIDVNRLEPIPTIKGFSASCGLTGATLKPFTLRNTREVAKNCRLPLIACGGMTTWNDALQAILLGATLVEFCTSIFLYGYELIYDLEEGLSLFLDDKGLASVAELVGFALPKVISPDGLAIGISKVSSINSDTCIRCGRCYRACRDGWHQAIRLDDSVGNPIVSKDLCKGDGFCATICPTESITMVDRDVVE